jgi:iron complex transport system ATP-binding protein
MLSATGLSIGYGRTVVSRDLSVALEAGQFVCLLGPNGAGKSTLLRTLAGMQPALAGEVHIEGSPLSSLRGKARARRLAVVLTERIGTGLLTARELVALGRQPYTGWDGRLREEDHIAVDRALADVGSLDYASRLVSDLSDGERQRIWLARALAQEPSVLLLDEVLAFLDLPRRVLVMDLLRRLAHQRRIGVVLSCHDLHLALREADRLWLLEPDGRLHVGTPDQLRHGGALASAFARDGIHFDPTTCDCVVAASRAS